MLRSAVAQFSRSISKSGTRMPQPIMLRKAAIARPIVAPRIPSLAVPVVRCYASSAGLGKEEITGRILDLLKNFDKVTDQSKLSQDAHFTNDLGLDSLDTVEVVMAIEEEFSIEIPDQAADAIQSVTQAVDYIKAQPDAH